MKDFEDKIAVITGGGTGMGRAWVGWGVGARRGSLVGSAEGSW